MVPVDIIMAAKSEGYPLFAVPEKYSAGQIEIIGKTLLHSPKVVRLLNADETDVIKLIVDELQLLPVARKYAQRIILNKSQIDILWLCVKFWIEDLEYRTYAALKSYAQQNGVNVNVSVIIGSMA